MISTYAAIATKTFYSDTEIAAGLVRTVPIFCHVTLNDVVNLPADMPCVFSFPDVLLGVGAYAASHRVNT
jgi:hypothetical protein